MSELKELQPENAILQLIPDDQFLASETRRIAYCVWVELSTRKVGVPIDSENDNIYEVYNSWYRFGENFRSILKNVDFGKDCLAYSGQTVGFASNLIDILNDVWRPHITKWSSRYRTWYSYASSLPENVGREPQEIQLRYPSFIALSEDLLETNEKLGFLRGELKGIVLRGYRQ